MLKNEQGDCSTLHRYYHKLHVFLRAQIIDMVNLGPKRCILSMLGECLCQVALHPDRMNGAVVAHHNGWE